MRKQRPTYAYNLCGWHTHSDIPLTNVPTSRNLQGVDVLIQIGRRKSPIANDCEGSDWAIFEHSVERSLIRIKNIADFEVNDGRQISIWPVADVARKDIEIFLFGPVWATLCHQRRVLPLHASAIVTKWGIAAFAGHSGVGKSTTAALMSSTGYELVTDDILPISLSRNSVPGAWPYLRRLKLQNDSITQLALVPTELVSETLDKNKFFVRPKYAAHDKWDRLDRLYLLEVDPNVSSISIDQVTGAEAVCALIDQTYHLQFVLGSGRFRDHLAFCTELASKTVLYRLRRSPSTAIGKEFAFRIGAHLQRVAA
jgi:hypothetical protein